MNGLELITYLPPWAVGVIMTYTGIIWSLSVSKKIRMDSKAIAFTQISWGAVYILSSIFGNHTVTLDDGFVRVFFSRLVIVMLCLSQSLPLTVSYIRATLREKEDANNT